MELVHIFDKLMTVKAFIFDVDGVMTDNTVLVTETGELLRTMNVRDGLAIKMAVAAQFPIGIITGGRSQGVVKRLKNLGVAHVYIGASTKTEAFNDFLTQHNLTPADILYIGDDLPDLPILKRVGTAVCPADAVSEVLEFVDYVSPLKGGHGCVRDVIEKVLKLQHKWEDALREVTV